ncbi:MAG: tRNA 2-thiouridine(34) synthase MnmA [Gammaproteobacteria bacterium]|nr:tRNA 2-thiouridine(34) synthase MnmA [Gammaproteobacteria bacterium]
MTTHRKPGVIVGMSGGVDSSVAALLLIQQGYAVEGLFMKNWEEDDDSGHCAAARDLADATAVCERLGIRLHRINFSFEYWESVFSRCLDEFRAGRTPNPDVLCNREIKFKAFLEHAQMLGVELVATGHYAGIENTAAGWHLVKARDEAKDQSYFLYMLGQRQLASALFPLTNYQKREVRALAEQAGLVTHDKKDSTGLCFIGERRFSDFLARFLPAQPGDVVDTDGRKLGAHRGLMFYTQGQRQGLGIGGRRGMPETPWYVVDKIPDANRLIVAQGHDHARLFSNTLTAGQLHWVAGEAPALPQQCTAKIRYRQQGQACVLDGTPTRLQVSFEQPQRAATPGQSVVFYRDNRCLGGGIIEQRSNTRYADAVGPRHSGVAA